MIREPNQKYRPFMPVTLPDRQWPFRQITKAPVWCSVDLRDGNQALIEPMGMERKLRMFELLLRMGFKEIEVGFPAASQTDYSFVRTIIDEDRIPDGVAIQVLSQCRRDLIEKTFEAIRGAKKAVVHIYNSTSEAQRRIVFQQDRPGIIDIARNGVTWVRELWDKGTTDTEIQLQYSPESFTGTELDFAIEICEAVMDIWEPTPERKMILNLPATVEMATPNVHADQIEYVSRTIKNRDCFLLSLHPHNDRGTAVAATELGLMAGADRVEGTLFGNGERTGNVDLVTLALNMYTQGVDPGLQIDDISELVRTYEYCNQLPVHPRHPYAGELVFTAFSGSHQDAINKGFAARARSNNPEWEIPYLPIDPRDIGRTYEAVIRINSQSGKGGIAYIMNREFGIELPRRLQIEFSRIVQAEADETGKEITAKMIWDLFEREYLSQGGPLSLTELDTRKSKKGGDHTDLSARVMIDDQERVIEGSGNGPIDAFFSALRKAGVVTGRFLDYREHAVGAGADATAVAFVEVADEDEQPAFGVGMDSSIVVASLRAVVSAVNRVSYRRSGGLRQVA